MPYYPFVFYPFSRAHYAEQRARDQLQQQKLLNGVLVEPDKIFNTNIQRLWDIHMPKPPIQWLGGPENSSDNSTDDDDPKPEEKKKKIVNTKISVEDAKKMSKNNINIQIC